MSLTAAYVTAVVAVLRLVLKKHAPKRVLSLLWLVVFVRLLVPVLLESPLSIIPDNPVMQLEENLPDQLEDENLTEDGVWEHHYVGSPFILGMVRPRIYLPAGLQGQPRQFILCHERALSRR